MGVTVAESVVAGIFPLIVLVAVVLLGFSILRSI